MGSILVIDSDTQHAAELARAVQTDGHMVTVCTEVQQAVSCLKSRPVDAVVLVSNPVGDWRNNAAELRIYAFQIAEPPQIVCLLRGPHRGPAEQLYGSRRGLKVVYEDN